jgi:ribosomal protein S18 acetylase RimI-like enzyme
MDSWYLDGIGVLPDYRRKGVAKALIQMVQKKVAFNDVI